MSWIVSKTLLVQHGGAPADCQTHIDRDIEQRSPQWLKLEHVLQNVKGKGIATLLGRIDAEKIVVKAQLASDARAEYEKCERLRGLPGFAKMHCLFFCSGNRDYIERFGTIDEQTKLCRARGDRMGVIVMPFYERGSFEMYLRGRHRTDEAIKRILCTVIQTVFRAYEALGFTHGDLFPKNVVLDHDLQPTVLDFEKTEFAKSSVRFWRDIDDLLGEVSRYALQSTLDAVSRVIFVHLAYDTVPSGNVIQELCNAIHSP